MAATSSSLTFGPHAFGPGLKMAIYTFVGGATGWLAAGNAIDMTGEFSEIVAAWTAGVNAVADDVYKFTAVFPKATTVTSSNVLMSIYYSNGSGGAMTVVPDATDISAVGQVQVVVIGK